MHIAIANTIGRSEVMAKSESTAPTTEPIPKRNIPVSELAVPATSGYISKMAALALLDTTDTKPTNIETPATVAHNPKWKIPHITSHAPAMSWIVSPNRKDFSTPILVTNLPLSEVAVIITMMFKRKKYPKC